MTVYGPYYPRCIVVLEAVLSDINTGVPKPKRIETITLEPKSATVERNPIEQADTARVEFEFGRFPMDPRAIRDIRVSVYIDDVKHPRRSVFANRSALRFVGFVDMPENSHDDKGDTTTLTARDYRGRLLDTPFTDSKVDATKRISEIARAAVNAVPGYETFAIKVDSDPTLRSYTDKSTWTPPSGASIWDVLVVLAHTVGLVAWFDLDTLRIGDPRKVEPDEVKILRFGENVKEMGFRRNMNPMVRKAIEMRGTNPNTRQVTSARWPVKPRAGEAVIVYPSSSPATHAQLQAMAQRVYESRERAQIEGSISTGAMLDSNGADMLDTAAGSGVYVNYRDASMAHLLGESEQTIVDRMVANGIDRESARALAHAYINAAEFRPLFYVRRCAIKWARSGGFGLTIDVENFVDVG